MAIRCGYRVEPFERKLEAGFDALTDCFVDRARLDERSLVDLDGPSRPRGRLRHDGERAGRHLPGSYADVERAIQEPKGRRPDRSMRRAVAYIRDHFTENLSLSRVARVAGFAPGYFRSCSLAPKKTTFHRYVRQLRIERAKHMLTATELTAERVGRLVGFATRSRFHVAFRESAGMAPLEYRRRNPPASVHLPVPKSRAD